jgi:hypothetical protein
MIRPEDQIQRSVLRHLELRGAEYAFWWHTPNAGKRSAKQGAQAKRLGLVAGVPDLCLVNGGKFYGLELKTPDGRLSDCQAMTLEALERAGGLVEVTYSLDAALACLEGWGLLRGEAQ